MALQGHWMRLKKITQIIKNRKINKESNVKMSV